MFEIAHFEAFFLHKNEEDHISIFVISWKNSMNSFVLWQVWKLPVYKKVKYLVILYFGG